MSRIVWILSVLSLGLVIRLVFLSAGGVVIDSDEAIVGLMAKHIAEGRQWPIFYYGQPYMGSLEPTLAAFVFKLLGVGVWELKCIPLIFSLLFIYLSYLLAEEVQGERAAKVASLLAALPPVAFVEWSLKARGGFIELVVLGTLAILITLKLCSGYEKKWRNPAFFGLSFLLGVAWWVNNQAIFYLIPIGLYLLFRFPFGVLLGSAPVALFGFALGGAPFWYANLFQEPKFATFRFLSGRSEFPGETLRYFGGVVTESLPILMGARRFWTVMEVFPYASLLGYLVLAVSLLAALTTRRVPALLPLTFLTIPLIFSLSSFGWLTSAPRYLLPLYSVLFVLFGVAAERRLLRWIIPAGALTLSIVSNYQEGVVVPGQPFVSGEDRAETSHTELYQWLKSRNYRHIRTNYWIGYRVAFETDEQVTFSLFGEPSLARIPEYEDIGRSYGMNAPFIIVRAQMDELLLQLSRMNVPVELTTIGRYIAVELLTEDSAALGQRIPLEFIRASSREEWLPRLADENLGTRWGSGMPQSPGMFIEGIFGEESQLGGLEIISGFWYSDRARGLSVELMLGDGGSCLLFDGSQSTDSLRGTGTLRLEISGYRGVGLKFYQTGSHPLFDWSIAEIVTFKSAEEAQGERK